MNKRMLIMVSGLLILWGCYRETGIEVLPVTASQSTVDNQGTLVRGTDAGAREGDLFLRNNQVQVVINGDLQGRSRDFYAAHSGGAIVDVATQFESGGNRTLTPRDDDGINQLSQGVNMNRHTPIGYDRVSIFAPDETEASITLTGGVYDMDGSLAAQGATVAADGRVLGCEVTTVYHMLDSEPIPDAANEGEFFDRAITHIAMTTIVTNTGQSTLPIFDVNDVLFFTQGTANTFVPYPDWGYDRPSDGSHAWPHFIHFQPKQINTTHYGYTAMLDGLLEVHHEVAEELNNDVYYVGKAQMPTGGISAGGAVTFLREFSAISDGSGGRSQIATQTFYDALLDLIVETEDPNSLYATLGRTSFAVRGDDDRVQMEGKITLEYINESVKYFNGSQYVSLEPGRTYPVFGDSPVSPGTASQLSYSLFVPGGQLAMRANGLNSDEFFVDKRVVSVLDEDGNVVTDEDGAAVTEEIDIIIEAAEDPFEVDAVYFGSFKAFATHKDIAMSVDDLASRDLYARVNVERVDEGAPLVLGEFPTDTQGQLFYVDRINAATSSNAARVWIPEGIYDFMVSRGPLNNVNIIRVNNKDEKPTDSEDPQFDDPQFESFFNVQLGPALSLPGYLSADFDARAASDPMGMVAELQVMLFAYAEDIDVLFFSNAASQSRYGDLFDAHGRTAGEFDQADQDGNVDSWFDEVAYARALGSIGRTPAGGMGRYTLLNLPDEDQKDFLETPLMRNDPPEFYDKARALGDGVLVHVTRPRAPEGLETGLFTAIAKATGLNADEAIPGDNPYYSRGSATGSATRWIDFDAMQLLAGKYYGEYLLTRADWFNLLNAGIYKPVTGGSSAGQTKDVTLGSVRTFVSVSDTTLRDIDLSEFWNSVRAGRMFVTNGPIIEATINGTGYGERTAVSGETVTASVKVSAAGWVRVPELRVIVNGVVVKKEVMLSGDTIRFEGNIEIPLSGDGPHWVVFEAGVSLEELATGTATSDLGTFGKVLPGHLPLGFTNPIFLD